MDLLDIKFECIGCGQRLVVESSAAGLNTDCPSCRRELEVPESTPRSLRPGGEAEIDPETHLLRQELAGATILATERDREMAILHEKLMVARHEAAEHRGERDRQAAVAHEKISELSELKQKQAELRRDLREEIKARAELNEARELTRQLATAQAAQLAARERDTAEAMATAGSLRDEMRALEGRLGAVEGDLAQARVELREKEQLRQTLAEFKVKQAEAEEVARVCASLQEEVGSLKRQLTNSAGGREVLSLRDRLQTAQEEAAKAERAASHAAAEVEKTRALLAREQADRDLLRKQCDAAEKLAASNSEAASESLRGIVERQKKELLEQYVIVGRLRRAQLGVRLIYGIIVLLVLGGVAAGVMWLQHSAVLAEWLR